MYSPLRYRTPVRSVTFHCAADIDVGKIGESIWWEVWGASLWYKGALGASFLDIKH